MHKVLLSISMMVVLFFNACCMTYSNEVQYENFTLRYSKVGKDAYISEYRYDENTTDIFIPEKYENYVINRLGGYFGRGVPDYFHITNITFQDPSKYDEGYITDYELADEEKYDNVYYYDINLHISKNISDIKAYGETEVIIKDGCSTAFVVRINAIVDEENKYFYSENGVIYDKKTNEKVDEFIYLSEWGK